MCVVIQYVVTHLFVLAAAAQQMAVQCCPPDCAVHWKQVLWVAVVLTISQTQQIKGRHKLQK